MHVLLASLLSLAPTAHAGDRPEVTVEDDGTVVARMLIDEPEAQVRSAIPEIEEPDPARSVLDVQLKPDGDCTGILRTTKGLWRPLTMQTRLCPTSRGWRERLVSSDDFDAYDVEWVVQGGEAGTMVQLRVRSEVNLAVPSALVRRSTMSGAERTLTALLERLLSRRKTD